MNDREPQPPTEPFEPPYEAPVVEELDVTDTPAVTAAGGGSPPADGIG